MALNSSNVLVAQTAAIYVADTGTTIPTTAAGVWDAAFVELGYVTPDGISVEPQDETAEIKAMQNGDTVRTLIIGSKLTLGFALMETTATGLELYYKGATVTGTGTGPASIEIKNPTAERHVFGLDIIDGSRVVRWTLGAGEVSERGAITYRNDEAITYPLTITAYPDENGVLATEHFSTLDGLAVAP